MWLLRNALRLIQLMFLVQGSIATPESFKAARAADKMRLGPNGRPIDHRMQRILATAADYKSPGSKGSPHQKATPPTSSAKATPPTSSANQILRAAIEELSKNIAQNVQPAPSINHDVQSDKPADSWMLTQKLYDIANSVASMINGAKGLGSDENGTIADIQDSQLNTTPDTGAPKDIYTDRPKDRQKREDPHQMKPTMDKSFKTQSSSGHKKSAPLVGTGKCTDDASCNIEGSDCDEGKCYCSRSRVFIDGKCVKTTEFGQECLPDFPCSTEKAVCSIASGSKNGTCSCPPYHKYVKDSNQDKCIPRGLNDACDDNQADKKCGGGKSGLTCLDNTCTCATGYKPKTGETTCAKITFALGGNCTDSDDCSAKDGACIKNICSCKEKFTPNVVANTCTAPMAELGDNCTNTDDCKMIQNSVCGESNGASPGGKTCQCDKYFAQAGFRCEERLRVLGEECVTRSECANTNETSCENGQCECRQGLLPQPDGTCAAPTTTTPVPKTTTASQRHGEGNDHPSGTRPPPPPGYYNQVEPQKETAQATEATEPEGFPTWAIAGIVVAVLVVVGAIAGLLVYFLVVKKRRAARKQAPEEPKAVTKVYTPEELDARRKKRLAKEKLKKRAEAKKHPRPRPMKFHKINLDEFVQRGPLVISKHNYGEQHALDGVKSHSISGDVEFDTKLNELFLIGSDTEVMGESPPKGVSAKEPTDTTKKADATKKKKGYAVTKLDETQKSVSTSRKSSKPGTIKKK